MGTVYFSEACHLPTSLHDAKTQKNIIYLTGLLVSKKVKWSRHMPWRHMGGEEVQLLLVLNLGTRWGWVVSVTPPAALYPRGKDHHTHWIGGWVGPRAGLGLDAGARRKILCPCRGSNPDRPACSQTQYWLSYRGSYWLVWFWNMAVFIGYVTKLLNGCTFPGLTVKRN
jgi:hypothetical protein